MPPRVTERSFYTDIKAIITAAGGSAVSEVAYNSEPDIIFDLIDREWVLSVKIGETPALLKSAFIQYQRHKDESRRNHGLLLLLPESARTVAARAEKITEALRVSRVACLVDTPHVKEEYRDATFTEVIERLIRELHPRLERRETTAFPLKLVISMLQEHVSELMQTIQMSHTAILRIITDKGLLSDIGHLGSANADEAARFLGAYILLSQILFLRLFSAAQPGRVLPPPRPVTVRGLREAFRKILEINYRPIYEIDVLGLVPPKYLTDTYDLISGLEVERSRYELPGRIFHELMPKHIRKMLAAFYTRPQAAELLARITVETPGATVFDPACGSGTILAAAYRRKRDLSERSHPGSNPHRRFCEQEIFGADIMPFAVHLASANLAAMDPPVTIARTQIIRGDSLDLALGRHYRGGIQPGLFPAAATARRSTGHEYEVPLEQVDTVLMNPPFTKVERGISRFVNMRRFEPICGGEVGLWGHFLVLADALLKDGAVFGGVIPISILRGRESTKVREFVFQHWTPIYIIKSTLNYGFSEWSEYRDVLLIAHKGAPPEGHQVKVCLIKQDLSKLGERDIDALAAAIKQEAPVRTPTLDTQYFTISDLRARFRNLMWFCGVSDLRHRDILVRFIERFTDTLKTFPPRYFREGYRPVPKGVSSFLFLTRASEASRAEEAFLRFSTEGHREIRAQSKMGVEYNVERSALTRTLRTGIAIPTMSIEGRWDYIAKEPYHELSRVTRASGFKPARGFSWRDFWDKVARELKAVETRLVVVRRINPFSPNTYLTAFFSETPFSTSNVLNVIVEAEPQRAKAVCVLLNSALFLTQFFLLKEETTGRYIDVRFYDLEEMYLYPDNAVVPALADLFNRFANAPFTALRDQLDAQFDARYEEFWELQRKGQPSLLNVTEDPVQCSSVRLAFDKAVCSALGVEVTEDELREVYKVLVEEMIVTRGLQRD